MPGIKVLYIVRHGKSSWDNETLADIDRPLKERGIRDAQNMAGRFKNNEPVPQRIITSPAIRAMHTAMIFCRILEIPEERIIISEDLFHAKPSEIIEITGKTPDNVESLMIFGHNPGFTHLANILSNLAVNNIPTCGLVKLVFETDSWKQIDRQYLVDAKFDYPNKA